MTRKNRTNRRRERRLLEEPQDSFFRDYEPVLGLLDEDDKWERGLSSISTYSGLVPRPARQPGKFDLDRMLWRPRRRFPDFDQVTETVSTGGMVKTRAEAETLVAAGITHVVNSASELYDEDEVFDGLPIEYLFNATHDNNTWKEPGWFRKTLDFAMPAIAQGAHVYLHCLEGINRGPSLAYAVLREQGHSIEEAHDLITKARPRAKMAYALDAEAARQAVS